MSGPIRYVETLDPHDEVKASRLIVDLTGNPLLSRSVERKNYFLKLMIAIAEKRAARKCDSPVIVEE